MNYYLILPVGALAYFILILLMLELGRRIGTRQLREDPAGARTGVGAFEGAVFGLLGLLIAFTFSGAAERFGVRRELLVQEVNAIGTAWLRLDLVPAQRQPALRQLFRNYVDQRNAYYQALLNDDERQDAERRATALQNELWSQSAAAVSSMAQQDAGALLLKALNDVIDITTTRAVALRTHPPTVIYLMLGMLSIISAILIGHGTAGSAHRIWLHSIGYALVMTVSLYIIVDFEFPRVGLIRIDQLDQLLVEARKAMD